MGRMRKAFGTLGVLLAGWALVGPGRAWADSVSAEQARTVAENFVTKDAIGLHMLPGRSVDAVTRRGGFYLVTLKPSGHVLVSANRSAEPVPKFSQGDFVEPLAGSPQEAMLAQAETNAIRAAGTKYEARWRVLLGGKGSRLTVSGEDGAAFVDPLLQSWWSQSVPYWDYAPVNNGYQEPNGCVATAYGQIMRYWEWPEKIDRDFRTEHKVDSTWGFEQQLWAGTPLNWSLMPLSWYATEADRMNIGRGIMLVGMLAKMGYAKGGSAAYNIDVATNPWYTPPRMVDGNDGGYDAFKEEVRKSLRAGCPFIVSIDNPGHSIVGDGFSESGSTFYIHVNYGWGGTSTDNYTLDELISNARIAGIIPGQRPRAMAMPDAVSVESKLPFKLGWSFPRRGYSDTLGGFTVRYSRVGSQAASWTENFTAPQGYGDGGKVAVETIGGEALLRFRTSADRVRYTWPSVFVGEDAVLSYDVRSSEAKGMTVTVQVYDPSTGWEVVSTPALNEAFVEAAWERVAVPLRKYANKAIALRVESVRHSAQVIGDSADNGVLFDNVEITDTRSLTEAGSVELGRDARSYSFADDRLSVGGTYVFTVSPSVEGCEPTPAVSTKIVADEPTVASIEAITSVGDTGYQVKYGGTYRDGYLGLNQFGVYGSSATTGLVVRLSHSALVDDGVPFYDEVFKEWNTSVGKRSIADVATVEKVRDGKFLVKLNFGELTYYLRNTRLIVTFEARDAKGNVARRDMNLTLLAKGDEGEIAKEELRDYAGGGDASDDGPSVVVTKYTVTFRANGGSADEKRQVTSGATIATFPTVSWTGHTLKGWFTAAAGGEQVYTSQQIFSDVTYYAQWDEVAGGEPGDEPDNVCVVTFEGGAVTLVREVAAGGAVGPLPNDLVKEGHSFGGWYADVNYTEKVTADRIVSGPVTFYAKWVEDAGGGTDDDGETAGQNDFTDGGRTYRFCVGVNRTSGYKDVSRSGTLTYRIPAAYNLVLWWGDAYKTLKGAYPTGYSAPNTSSLDSEASPFSLQAAATKLFKTAMGPAMPSDADRAEYFPTAEYAASEWCGGATGDAMLKAAGRRIYTELNNGPIGILIPTSSTRTYGGVIWGCEYADDGDGKYAKVVYFTSTRLNNNDFESATLGSVTVSGVGTMPGLAGFNSNGGVISTYYPIVGPAGKQQGGGGEPATKTYTVTFNTDGGTPLVNARSVVKGGTINPLPTTSRTGKKFVGWYDADGVKLTTATPISSAKAYTARWEDEDTPPDTPTVFTVTFVSDGDSISFGTKEVADGEAVGAFPSVTKSGYSLVGWYDAATGGNLVDENKVIAGHASFYARWEQAAAPVDPAEGKVGVASNEGDPGTFYTHYAYTMNDNYWTARKLAIQQRKQLFILSGAAWCSNCSFVKDYLQELGARFSDAFVAYFSDHDDSVDSPYFHGGLPQYGAADPRKVDAFTGTLDGAVRTWSSVWTTAGCGVYAQDRGGYAPARVETVVNAGIGKGAIGSPTNLVIRGLSTLAAGYAGRYELYAQFDDGVEMPVDHGVTWEVVRGAGTVVDAKVDGRQVGALTVSSGSVTLRARSSFYFTGTASMDVAGADLSGVESVAITTESVNLEDDAAPQIAAVATMADGSTVPVVGFGDWSAVFKARIPRADAELEEDNVTPSITFDGNSRLTYAKTYGQLAVCDQKIDVTLSVNGRSVTKEITVWGPTKVAPSKWKMVSGPRQTLHGVVRLQCTELKYNYGGKVYTTTDTYFASYKTVLKFASGSMQTSYLRGLTVISDSVKDETCVVGLAATKVNGKFSGYTPESPTSAPSATNFTNVAKGSAVTELARGEVPSGFFRAFFPGEDSSRYGTLADEDSDGDGFRNWEEYVLGTDPTNAGDGFTLMQGYQHLTAPAANGETMQYKVMYQQRAYRVYFIDAKVNWSDAWKQVARVDLGNMQANSVTTFTGLDAAYADGAKFFKVRAALTAHDFSDPATAPQVAPAMLVANRGATIDLTKEKLPLALSSFDTDATDPGEVYVDVPADAAPGAVLLTAPASALASLKACRPCAGDGRTFVVESEPGQANRLQLRLAGPAPSVRDGRGTVEVVDGKAVVTPAEGVSEIALAGVGEGQTVELPPSVGKVTGVPREQIRVRGGTKDKPLDLTGAMRMAEADGGVTLALDPEAKVSVDGEDIPVRPALAGADESKPPLAVAEGTFSLSVRTIPGLRYRLLSYGTLGGEPTAGEARAAEGSRLTLEAPKGAASGFFKVEVMP